MKFGVPLVMLVVLILPGLVAGMWLSILVSWMFAPAIFGAVILAFFWMRYVTSRDDQRLGQMLMSIKLALRNPNRSLRDGARSYAPVPLKGGRDVWRR